LCLVAVGHESSQEQLAEDDIAAKFENCFITFLLPHLGHAIASPPRTNVSKFSPHSAQVNSNIGIFVPYFIILQKIAKTILRHARKENAYFLNTVRFL
jgi:hypothetical protein